MKTKLKSNIYSIVLLAAVLGIAACASPEANNADATLEGADTTSVEVVEEMLEEAPVDDVEPNLTFEIANMSDQDRIIIYEDGMTHQPAPKEGENKTAEERNKDSQFLKLYNERFLPQASDLDGFMISRDFEQLEVVETTVLAIPMEETQTVIAFNKKDKFEGQVQVVSASSTGEVAHIVFTGKHHVDKYNVSAGLTGHEARKLRRELKHMAHQGQVFLYVDESNIMYLMDSKNLATGEEVTEADVDSMIISAVIWKDAKHHNEHDQAHGEGDGHNH